MSSPASVADSLAESVASLWREVGERVVGTVRGLSLGEWAVGGLGAVGAFAGLEYLRLRSKAAILPGPSFTPPFLGTIVAMIKRPFQYYADQQAYGPISWNVLLGQFVVFLADAQLSKKVFSNCSGGSSDYKLSMTLGGNRIFGKNNLIYMPQGVHKAVRRRFIPLFTRRALQVYLAIQQRVVMRHLHRWIELSQTPTPTSTQTPTQTCPLKDNSPDSGLVLRDLARDMNIETSTEVFVGPYISHDMRARFAELYFAMNEGFLAIPIFLPGTTLWKAVRAKDTLVALIEGFVAQSKQRMALPGAVPECLLDVWMEAELASAAAAAASADADAAPEDSLHRDNHSIACLLLDFLFAAQDASTSSIVWSVSLLCDNPDILNRVRQEQHAIRSDGPIDPDMTDKMIYTRQVMREVLRYRPPATMVPHETVRDTPITDSYAIPKGTIVLPSIWAAHFTDFPNADTFDPDRFAADAKKTDANLGSNFLAFGAGPHMCPGREYAMNHLTMFIALFSTTLDATRIRTPVSDNIIFGPTIYPEDGCIVKFTPASSA